MNDPDHKSGVFPSFPQRRESRFLERNRFPITNLGNDEIISIFDDALFCD